MARLPTTSDFPVHLTLSITPPPEGKAACNVLIILHGLGDSQIPFTTLARQLNLPETAVISLRAPSPMPFELGGFHWGDDILFDQSSGNLDPDAGFEKSIKILCNGVIGTGLVQNCGFAGREIMVWGLGQGGMVALGLAEAFERTMGEAGGELGGVISVGGPLPGSTPSRSKEDGPCKTPVLLLGGSAGSAMTAEQVGRVRRMFAFVEHKRWKRTGDGMPRSRDEMMPIMQFFARRLRSKQGVPEGAVEIRS